MRPPGLLWVERPATLGSSLGGARRAAPGCGAGPARNSTKANPATALRRLLSARVPELSEADIAALVRPDSDAIPAAIGDKIAAVIEALEAKLAALERRLAA